MTLRSGFFHTPSFFMTMLGCSLSLMNVTPAHSKAANVQKAVSAADRAVQAIDRSVKSGQLRTVFVLEAEGDAGGRWLAYGSKEEADKANPKGYWRSGTAYMDGPNLLLADLETKTPTKEWVQRIRYYFRNDGSLQKARSDFRSFGAYEKKQGPERQFLVKVTRDRYYDAKGQCIKKGQPRFLNMSTHREPKGVVFTDGPWPVYPSAGKVPFFDMLKQQSASNK